MEAGRLHVATLMNKMGIETIYRRPNTAKPAPGHKIYPSLLRRLAVTRPNNDATDAEAICEAVGRPTMRFVPVKSEEQQSVLMLHRVRELLIRQRTILVTARGRYFPAEEAGSLQLLP